MGKRSSLFSKFPDIYIFFVALHFYRVQIKLRFAVIQTANRYYAFHSSVCFVLFVYIMYKGKVYWNVFFMIPTNLETRTLSEETVWGTKLDCILIM